MANGYSLATVISVLCLFSTESKIISNFAKNSGEPGSLAQEAQIQYMKSNAQDENDVNKLIHDNNVEVKDYEKFDEDNVDFGGLQNRPLQLDSLLSRVVMKQLRKQLRKQFQIQRNEKYKELANHISSFSSPFQGCSSDPCPSSESGKIQKFKINLDIHPEERWKEVMEAKESEITNLAKFFEYKLGKKFMSFVDNYISWLHNTLPTEYFLELQGISKTTNISIGRVTMYNVFYEFFSVCTSIIMEGEDGKMYHGRNLDFGLFMGWDAKNHSWFLTELLRPLIIKVDFYKNEKLLYSAVTYAGYTGILTGVKENQFSLTIDERFNRNGGYLGLIEWMLGRRDESWLGLLTRQVMESADSYKQAQQMLVSTNLVAPVYFILAGNLTKQVIVVHTAI